MTTRLQIPRVLQTYAGGADELELGASTVGQLLNEVRQSWPRLYECICDETGRVRTHINLFLNDDLLVFPDSLRTRIKSDDVVSVFQSVSGG